MYHGLDSSYYILMDINNLILFFGKAGKMHILGNRGLCGDYVILLLKHDSFAKEGDRLSRLLAAQHGLERTR